MAIKVKRKQSKHQAAKEPDQIYTFSEKAFNALEKNRKIVLGSLAAVLVLIVAITLIARQVSKSSQEEGASLMSAALLVDAPIGAAPEGETSFESAAERAEAVRVAIAEQLELSDPPPAARLIDAISSLELGDMTRAGASYEALTTRRNDLPLMAAVAHQGLAGTEAASGDHSAAHGALDGLKEAAPGLEHFARLERARLAEAAGDFDVALAEYQTVAATAGLVITDTGVSTANEALVETARHRAAVLGVILGEAPVEDEPGDEAEDDSTGEEPTDDEGGADGTDGDGTGSADESDESE